MRTLDELLHEAKWGKLTQEELDYVVNRIKESKNQKDPDLYILIYTLGKSKATQYRELVESFLYYPSDANISAIAFNALVNYWDLITEYTKEIKLFLKGMPWDDQIVRISAIYAAGRYLSGYEDKEMLSELIRILLDKNEEDFIRESAYSALAFARGRTLQEMCAEEIDYSILAEAKLRLAKL